MNMPAQVRETSVSATSLILQGDSFVRIMEMADVMASGLVSVPKHFHKNKGDCAAIVMQAMQWNMNPYAVAQKTYMSPGGTLAYEAQLVNAIINSIGPLDGRPRYEFIGDWDKILGRVKEISPENKGKYYVRDWQLTEEAGLGVICYYKISGEPGERQAKLMLSQCWPRFSTQWATDPQQQIAYSIIKKVARREFPDVILGVYTPDELETLEIEREVNPSAQPTIEQPTAEQQSLPDYPSVPFENSFPKWKLSIEKGACTTDDWIATLSKKGRLSEEMIRRINEVKGPIEVQAEVVQ